MTPIPHPGSLPQRSRRLTVGRDVWAIRTQADYDRAARIVDKLAVRPEGSLKAADQARLDIFTELISAYDRAHGPRAGRRGPLRRKVKFLIDQGTENRNVFVNILKSPKTVQAVLVGTRDLTASEITLLARAFKISPAYFFDLD